MLRLNAFEYRGAVRARKTPDRNALDRLHEEGLVSDPRGAG